MRLFLLTLLLLAAPAWAQGYDALVLSQGAFGAQNGSVVAVRGSEASPIATGRIYTQGAEVIGSRLFLTAGDSFSGTSRVDVLDATTGTFVGQITQNVLNPRYLADVGFGKAYVTNQDYSGGPSFVTPIDLATLAPGARIEVEGTAEDVALAGGRAFVALGAFGGKDSLAVLDPSVDAVVGYVGIGCAARFVAPTSGYVWAVCTDTDEAVAVDPASLEVVQRVAFGIEIGDPNGIGQDANTAGLAVTRMGGGTRGGEPVLITSEQGIIVLDGEDGTYEIVPIADAATRPITAIGAYPRGASGPFVLGRPDPDAPFSANGTITVHDSDGTLLETFAAGVFPSYVAMNPNLTVAAAEALTEAAGLGLALAGPNPLRQSGALALTLDAAADVRVDLVDVLGRTVAVLAEGSRAAGTHRLAVDAGALPTGTYLARVTAGGRTATLPLTVAR